MHEYSATHAPIAIGHEAVAMGHKQESSMFLNRFDSLAIIAAPAVILVAAVARRVASSTVRP